jgi:outer membrane protein TolC
MLPESLAQQDWVSEILQHNHELGMARADSRRAQLMAQRVDADRLPDPSVGLRVGSEVAGEQRLVGLSLIIPLPGSARFAAARSQNAQADATASREAAVERKVRAEAETLLAQARAAYEAWERSEAAARQTRDAAKLTEKAKLLGEADLAQWLLAQRQSFDADLTALQARIDAREAASRLALDAHLLWDLDEDGDGIEGAQQ